MNIANARARRRLRRNLRHRQPGGEDRDERSEVAARRACGLIHTSPKCERIARDKSTSRCSREMGKRS